MERKTLSHPWLSSLLHPPPGGSDLTYQRSPVILYLSCIYAVSGTGDNGDYLKKFICLKLLCVGDNCGQTSHHVLVCCGQPASDVLSSFRTHLLLLIKSIMMILARRRVKTTSVVTWWVCYDSVMTRTIKLSSPGGGSVAPGEVRSRTNRKKDATVIWDSHTLSPSNTQSLGGGEWGSASWLWCHHWHCVTSSEPGVRPGHP